MLGQPEGSAKNPSRVFGLTAIQRIERLDDERHRKGPQFGRSPAAIVRCDGYDGLVDLAAASRTSRLGLRAAVRRVQPREGFLGYQCLLDDGRLPQGLS